MRAIGPIIGLVIGPIMGLSFLAVQVLNGLQFGLILFLIAAGLTLVFGVMNVINLAHGVQYMVGAYFFASLVAITGDFFWSLLLALVCSLLFGLLLELVVFRHLYHRDHLDQVLATFGLIIFLNEAVKFVWGAAPLNVALPSALDGSVELIDGFSYPVYRIVVIAAGLAAAIALHLFVSHTRVGMRVQAGAHNPDIASALGVDIGRLFLLVFGVGAMLAGFAGAMIAPITAVQPGMGDNILILSFVVVVIGGIGSIRGAFVGAMMIGLVDTVGRLFLPDLLRVFMSPAAASQTGRAMAPMLIYLLMALTLWIRPSGLFSQKA